MDRTITRKCARFSTVLIWNPAALPFGLHHVDDPDQLHRIRWNLHDSFWRTSRHPSLWTRPTMACLGNRSSEYAQCWRYVTISILLENFVPARFKVGQMIGSSGILMGLSYAMYRNVDADKRH